jgi:hypothetical protein
LKESVVETVKRGKVTGIKRFEGEIEGKRYDNGTVFVEARLKGETSKGYASQPYKCTSSAVVKKIEHNEFPMLCDLTVEEETDGRGEASQVVTSVKPVDIQKPKAA